MPLPSPSVPGNVHSVPGTWLLQGIPSKFLHMHCLENTPPSFIHRHVSQKQSPRQQELLPHLLPTTSFKGLRASKVLLSACSSSMRMVSGTQPGWTGGRAQRAHMVCSRCHPLKLPPRLARPSHLGLRKAFHSPRWQRKVHGSLYGSQSNRRDVQQPPHVSLWMTSQPADTHAVHEMCHFQSLWCSTLSHTHLHPWACSVCKTALGSIALRLHCYGQLGCLPMQDGAR